MIFVDAAEAEADFYTLIEKVERGEEVIITRDGEPFARLVAAEHERGSPAPELDATADPSTAR